MTNTITVTYGRKQPGTQEYSSESMSLSITRDLGPDPVAQAPERRRLRQMV